MITALALDPFLDSISTESPMNFGHATEEKMCMEFRDSKLPSNLLLIIPFAAFTEDFTQLKALLQRNPTGCLYYKTSDQILKCLLHVTCSYNITTAYVGTPYTLDNKPKILTCDSQQVVLWSIK